jgi:glycosyltransferase involved in cell wall biosynthesis
MRILVLTDVVWLDWTGGISKSLSPEVETLTEQGHQLTVVSRKLECKALSYELKNSYEIYRYSSPPKKSSLYRFYPVFTLIRLPKLVTSLHRLNPFDVAYVHNPFQGYAVSKILPGIPLIYVYHASAFNEINIDAERGKYGRFKFLVVLVNRWIKSLERKILKNASQIIVRSQFMKSDLRHLYPDVNDTKITSLPLCVNTSIFSYAESNANARQKLGLPDDRPILLTVRRLVARMGIENLISAMLSVIQEFPNVLLLIGGAGYLAEDLRAMIERYGLQHNIHLVGFIPEEQLPTYYQASDLFILPTLAYEGFGLVTIESLACGTPVIATSVGASPEILNPMGKEFLFKDNSPSSIAEGIRSWLKQGFSPDMRRECMKYCIEHYSSKKVTEDLEIIFSKSLL